MGKLVVVLLLLQSASAQTFIRLNHAGFTPDDRKSAVVISSESLEGQEFRVVKAGEGTTVFRGRLRDQGKAYGGFAHTAEADFSPFKDEGDFFLAVGDSSSRRFPVRRTLYNDYATIPLWYLLQQRCGYNPVFDTVCHVNDGIAIQGPDSGTSVYAVGGYHDASDYLRFLITTSSTTGLLLLTYVDHPALWPDMLDDSGRSVPNGVPDILDEARWGLEWMSRLNPDPDKLYHQVADDRDHAFWDLPYRDSTDYGWGRRNARPVYFATGKPQGLFQHQNTSTGLANIAGRSAAVFALGSSVWKERDPKFSRTLRDKAVALFAQGEAHPGTSESVPCRAPYRFHEVSYADDMEWGGAELFRVTGDSVYLRAAIQYAYQSATEGWMGKDTARHYEYFPYVNMGHYRLFGLVQGAVRDSLMAYYRSGLQASRDMGKANAFRYGVPPIWVSNNLAAGLATQAILYKKMSGSPEFDDVLVTTRDWLLGRNPWGQSFVIGIPSGGGYPTDPHSVVKKELGLELRGALVDGPVYASIFRSLKGLRLVRDDPFKDFQSERFVYHDDLGDYSTNEPTIDGTAALLYIFAAFAVP